MSDHDNRLPTADWAQFYIDTFGLALVPIEPGEKEIKFILILRELVLFMKKRISKPETLRKTMLS